MRKLDRLIEYFSTGISITKDEVIMVVDDTHATERLRSKSGTQIVVSYPQMEAEGDSSDHSLSSYSVVIFVIEPLSDASRTPEKERQLYHLLLKTVETIINSIREVTTDFENAKGLLGMQLKSTSTTPIYKIFGGWSGWLVELEFK